MNSSFRTRLKSNSKTPQINLWIKIILVTALILVIYFQLKDKSNLFEEWRSYSQSELLQKWYFLTALILLLPINMLLEIMKWHVLVNRFEKHSFRGAAIGVFTGITAGLVTPARIGEYVGRLMLISPGNNWKAVWSNFARSIAQNLINIALGLTGLLLLLSSGKQWPQTIQNFLIIASLIISLLLILLYYNLHILVKLRSYLPERRLFMGIRNSLAVFTNIEKNILHKVLFYSLLRYLVFVLQYYLALRFWGIEHSFLLFAAISAGYLVQSLIPVPPLLGLLVRGEIALIVFGSFSTNGLVLVSAAFTLWIINLLVPALIGLLFYSKINITKTMGYGG